MVGCGYVSWPVLERFRKFCGKQKRRLKSDVLLPSLCRTDEGDAVIMHPGVLCIVVRLLPQLYHEDHPQVLVVNT